MTIKIGAIADDYTGASDLANTWSKSGLRTLQVIGIPSGPIETTDIDAVVVSLKIRSVAAVDAVTSALEAEAWLRGAGATHVLYKICSTFDSTAQGNIGRVMDALAAGTESEYIIISPAFPETGRTVYQGHLFVGEQLLNESPLRHHPLNPMTDSNLARVLAPQTHHKIANLNLQTLHSGSDTISSALAAFAKQGAKAIIADAIEHNDLMILGELALKMPVSIGASGLGLGLAGALRSEQTPYTCNKTQSEISDKTGYSAIIVGSCSARTLEQIAAAEKIMPVLRLETEQLVANATSAATAIEQAFCWAKELLTAGPVVIAASGTPEQVAYVQQRYGKDHTSQMVESALASIAEGLINFDVKTLVVAGGETSGAVVDRLKITGFLVGAEIALGVPALTTIGRDGGELSMALKSGNFGGIDFFADALEELKHIPKSAERFSDNICVKTKN